MKIREKCHSFRDTLILMVLAATIAGVCSASAAGMQSRVPQPVLLRHAESRNSVTGTLTTDRPNYRRGGSVHFRFVIRNDSDSNVSYDFLTTKQFDISVVDGQGVEKWRWSTGRAFGQQITGFELKPGASRVFTAVWNHPKGPAGVYTANATLTPSTRPAIRGGTVVDPDTDPSNMGVTERSRIENGNVVEVNVTPSVTASALFTLK